MKCFWLSLIALPFIFSSCLNTSKENIISQRFVHKYGFIVDEKEWKNRDRDGKIEQILDNGVHVVKNYENGKLQGLTTHTFPYSPMIEKHYVYDQGELLKEIIHDRQGIPIVEEVYEYDQRTIITHWDAKGAPIRIEEYEDAQIITGTYFNSLNEVESKIENRSGTRHKRDREGTLLLIDQIQNSILTHRVTYHPNNQIHMTSHFENYQLQGNQKIYSPNGQVYLELNWQDGLLNGPKISYRNGIKFQHTSYVLGLKEGIERNFDEQEALVSEITYQNDLKHGMSVYYSRKDSVAKEWFYLGHLVTQEKFEMLIARDEMVAQMDQY